MNKRFNRCFDYKKDQIIRNVVLTLRRFSKLISPPCEAQKQTLAQILLIILLMKILIKVLVNPKEGQINIGNENLNGLGMLGQ